MSSDLRETSLTAGTAAPQGLSELRVPTHWRSVDIISDIHLDGHEPAAFLAWRRYLETAPVQAVIVLGDLFEAWVGDDALNILGALPNRHEGLGFDDRVIRSMRFASERMSLYFMPGNRDFLLGDEALAACNTQRLSDPCVLALGDIPEQRVLLSHGDAWCTDDEPYMQFRSTVRTPAWQQGFLAKPLQERQRLAADMRAQSTMVQRERGRFADVSAQTVRAAAESARCGVVVHGHTHEGKSHSHRDGSHAFERHVTLDWTPLHAANGSDLGIRAQALRLQIGPHKRWQVQRVDL